MTIEVHKNQLLIFCEAGKKACDLALKNMPVMNYEYWIDLKEGYIRLEEFLNGKHTDFDKFIEVVDHHLQYFKKIYVHLQ
jgi:hypothetical protein